MTTSSHSAIPPCSAPMRNGAERPARNLSSIDLLPKSKMNCFRGLQRQSFSQIYWISGLIYSATQSREVADFMGFRMFNGFFAFLLDLDIRAHRSQSLTSHNVYYVK